MIPYFDGILLLYLVCACFASPLAGRYSLIFPKDPAEIIRITVTALVANFFDAVHRIDKIFFCFLHSRVIEKFYKILPGLMFEKPAEIEGADIDRL